MENILNNWIFDSFNELQVKKDLDNNQLIVPGSKSISQRLLIMASLKGGETLLKNFLIAEDTLILCRNLELLGVRIQFLSDGILLHSNLIGLIRSNTFLDFSFYFADSGASLRFFFAFLLLFKGSFFLNASDQLKKRPIDFIIKDLEANFKKNLSFSFKEIAYSLPLFINISNDFSIKNLLKVSVDKTSQWLSGLLLILPYLKEGTQLILNKSVDQSATYISLTERLIAKYSNACIEKTSSQIYTLKKFGVYTGDEFFVEADLTHVSYFFNVIALIGGKLRINGVSKYSLQGDIFYCELLEQLGAEFNYGDEFIEMKGPINLLRFSELEVDMKDNLDLVPSLAILACFLRKRTRIFNIKNLIYKESNRLIALVEELTKLGLKIEHTENSLCIYPKDYRDYKRHIRLETYYDHRLVMAFSLIPIFVKGITINHLSSVRKSFPNFHKLWNMFLNSRKIFL